ncbi:vitamin K epoxide reductase family protein [Alicyclobacillus sp. SO9]|uniref:vitamin K epoxide reductase family protein n=1 Tax=Alicyclobacillus sp. SO9 TaxID=2665646 RepID=UPI0018E89478
MMRVLKNTLLISGFIDSCYLLLYKYHLERMSFCPTHGCDTVNMSHYSDFFGIPVAFIGIIGYIVLFLTQLSSKNRFLNLTYTLLIFIAFSFSTYLTLTELLIIHAVCFWCAISFMFISTLTFIELYSFISNLYLSRSRLRP